MLRRLFDVMLHAENNPSHPSGQSPRQRSEQPTNAHDAVENAISELSRTIHGVESALARAEEDTKHIAKAHQAYQQRAQILEHEAKKAVIANNEHAARELLEEQKAVLEMSASYQTMLKNVGATVKKLTEQHRRMLVQRDEIKSRRTVIEAQLSVAHSQEEFLRNLQTLGLSHEVLEEELMKAHIRVEMNAVEGVEKADEYSLAGEVEAASHTASGEEMLARLNAELEREREQQRYLEEEASRKKFALAFENQSIQKSYTPHESLPSSLSPQDKMKSFFANADNREDRLQQETNDESATNNAHEDAMRKFFNR
jgi:phage shock protein A